MTSAEGKRILLDETEGQVRTWVSTPFTVQVEGFKAKVTYPSTVDVTLSLRSASCRMAGLRAESIKGMIAALKVALDHLETVDHMQQEP